jgi:hypothetical protein
MMTPSRTPTQDEQLLPQHAALVSASAISPEVARSRGYRSVTKRSELRKLGFGERQCSVPALLIPVWDVAGQIGTYQIRPDQPRIGHDGKPVKYETPGRSRIVLDVPPASRDKTRDPSIPLFITEGIPKADAAASTGLCCIALLGVWNWRGTNQWGGKTALADWEYIALNGRTVYICFDSDVMTKPQVHQALTRLKAFLEQRGACVFPIWLPPTTAGGKVGLDDYLAEGHTVADLVALASDPEWRPVTGSAEPGRGEPYVETDEGLVWMKPTFNGEVPVRLTNFTARIVGQVLEDDGAETRRLLEIEARLHGRESRCAVSPSELAVMTWPIQHLGPEAVVHAGFGVKDHTRAAIQLLSGPAPERRVFTHTGWRKIDGVWCYLHAGGAIGPAGAAQSVSVELPEELRLFSLPAPPDGDRLVQAVRASLRVLELAPDSVTVPIFCAIWRAGMMPSDFALHISGDSGEGKTELAALAQQHWGAGLTARNLPASWSSTGNANEMLAFLAKDALLVVDDLAPAGSAADIGRMHRDVDRLVRAQGNRQGRRRLRADGALRPARPPRGLILSTGEDVPRGKSLRARLLVVELPKGSLNWDRLTECQADASQGRCAETMAGFVKWLADRYEGLAGPNGSLEREIRELRQAAVRSDMHRRTPEIIANLAVGLRHFLTFAQHVGALTAPAATSLCRRAWRALGQAGNAHSAHQVAAEPTTLFLRLLGSAVASGRAYLAGPDGGVPEDPRMWGWREEHGDLRPQGGLTGWVAGADVYLEPDSAFATAQAVGQATGDLIPITQQTLHRRLAEAQLLASVETSRGTLTIRKTLAGARRTVLHLHSRSLISHLDTDQTDQSEQGCPDDPLVGGDGQRSGQLPLLGNAVTDHTNCPEGKAEGSAATGVGSRQQHQASEPAQPAPPPTTLLRAEALRPCYTCRGTRFWRDAYGADHCATCHPPADASAVCEWVEAASGNVRKQSGDNRMPGGSHGRKAPAAATETA